MKSKLTPSIAAGCGVGASGSGHSAGSYGSTAQTGKPPATAGWAEEPARELAQRQSGTLEVLLLWHAQNDLVELSVRDLATGGAFTPRSRQTVRSTPSTTPTSMHPRTTALIR
jgi:hypothetical protein